MCVQFSFLSDPHCPGMSPTATALVWYQQSGYNIKQITMTIDISVKKLIVLLQRVNYKKKKSLSVLAMILCVSKYGLGIASCHTSVGLCQSDSVITE